MFFFRYLLFYFIFLFLVDSYNQHRLSIFIVSSLGLFVIFIFIRIWFINYPQDQIIMLRGVIDEVYEILSELPGSNGFRILVLLPHGRLEDGHPYPIPCLFLFNINRVGVIWVTSSAGASWYIEDYIYICTASFSFFIYIFTLSFVDTVGVFT